MTHDLLVMRDYQREAIEDFRKRVLAGDTRVPSVLATGLGKTVIFSHLASQWEELRQLIDSRPGRRILVLAHTDELVLQAARKIKQVAPHLSVGIVKAERNEASASVVVASVQSLRSEKRRAQLRNVGLIIVDECHHATAPTYRKILEHFGALLGPSAPDQAAEEFTRNGPTCIVAGFTATLARGDKAKLSEVWQACTFKRGISFGIRRGYLLDVRGKRIVVPDLDLSKVKKSGGDYQDSALADAMEEAYAPEIIAKDYAAHAVGRKGLVFWPTVESAERGAEAFREQGIPSAVVHGMLDRETRRRLLRELASGEIQVVHNCAVLTEGFDDPTISCVVIARPTRSAPLYQQMVGRGLRPDLSLPAEERGNCLVLDVVGASRAHDLRSLVDLSEAEIREEVYEDEDLTLLEMEEQELLLEEAEGALAGVREMEELYTGETVAAEFDPLGRTTIGAWLKTADGTYFLPAGSGLYVLLVPSEEPGSWDVAWLTQKSTEYAHVQCGTADVHVTRERVCSCGARHSGQQGATTEHRGLSLEMACSWAEEVMEDFGHGIGSLAKSRWRKTAPSDAQLRMARGLGVVVPEGQDVSKGAVADLISEALGSRRIDPIVQFMITSREG
jgi:superfamily II DNA or RNA helicase